MIFSQLVLLARSEASTRTDDSSAHKNFVVDSSIDKNREFKHFAILCLNCVFLLKERKTFGPWIAPHPREGESFRNERRSKNFDR
jgi:hypothetical protein